jgi:hypothetical protein
MSSVSSLSSYLQTYNTLNLVQSTTGGSTDNNAASETASRIADVLNADSFTPSASSSGSESANYASLASYLNTYNTLSLVQSATGSSEDNSAASQTASRIADMLQTPESPSTKGSSSSLSVYA